MLRKAFREEVGLGIGSVLVPKTRLLFGSQNGCSFGASLAGKFVVRFWGPFGVRFWVRKWSQKGAQNGAHNVQVYGFWQWVYYLKCPSSLR